MNIKGDYNEKTIYISVADNSFHALQLRMLIIQKHKGETYGTTSTLI